VVVSVQELPLKTTGTESDGHQALWFQQGLDWGQAELEEVGERKTTINKMFDLCLKAAACFSILPDYLKTKSSTKAVQNHVLLWKCWLFCSVSYTVINGWPPMSEQFSVLQVTATERGNVEFLRLLSRSSRPTTWWQMAFSNVCGVVQILFW